MNNRLLLFVAICCFFCLASITRADEIKLTNGQWLLNVLVADTIDNTITVITPSDTRHFKLTMVEEIIKAPYNPLGTLIISNAGSDKGDLSDQTVVVQKVYIDREYPNLPFLTVSILAALISVDMLITASDIEDDLGELRKYNILNIYDDKISRYESLKSRKQIIGWTLAVGSLVNLFWCTRSIEVEVKSDRVKLSYGF